MASASRVSGFPVNLTTGTESGTVVPANAGDLMIVSGRRGNNVADVTGITGGGCTNWTKVAEHVDATDFIYSFMWMGTVTTPGSQTLTLNTSDPGVSSEVTIDSFHLAGASWVLDVAGNGGNPASVPTFPSLTSTRQGPNTELYYGWMFTSGTESAGSTPGFTYEGNPFGDGQVVWSVTVGAGATQPTFTAGSGTWLAVAAIFMPLVTSPFIPHRMPLGV